MRKRNSPNKTSQKISRERDPLPWRYCLLTLVCGVFLVAGFFFAARSHFASVDFGIKNSRLKKQLEELEAEKRQLLLTKEIALTPTEIKKSAKKLGFVEMAANGFGLLGDQPAEKSAKTDKSADAKPKTQNAPAGDASEKKSAEKIKSDKAEIKKQPEMKKETKLNEVKGKKG